MQIHELENVGKKDKKRVGRGGKRGTTAGRGTKGQKARSGGNVNPLFEGGRSSLIQRMKKLRGFKSPHAKKNVISLEALNDNFEDGDTVSTESLQVKGLIRKRNLTNGVKILGTGTCKKKLKFSEEILMSESVKKIFDIETNK